MKGTLFKDPNKGETNACKNIGSTAHLLDRASDLKLRREMAGWATMARRVRLIRRGEKFRSLIKWISDLDGVYKYSSLLGTNRISRVISIM